MTAPISPSQSPGRRFADPNFPARVSGSGENVIAGPELGGRGQARLRPDITTGNLLRSALATAAFGFGDEIEAGVRSALGPERYKDTRDSIRRQQEAFAIAHPAANVGATLYGAGLTAMPGVSGALALRGGKLGQNAILEALAALHARGAAQGAVAPAPFAGTLARGARKAADWLAPGITEFLP